MNKKPDYVQAIEIMSIISGILNILAALFITTLVVIGTLGIGLLCAPLTLVPIVLGIFEILNGVNLTKFKAQNTKVLAIFQIASILWANMFSMIIGILILVFLQNDEVEAYFTEHNMK